MSKTTTVWCDFKDGECMEENDGFEFSVTDKALRMNFEFNGWSIDPDDSEKHYCPEHTKEMAHAREEKESKSQEASDSQVQD